MNEELKNIIQQVKHLYMKYGIKSVTMDDVARELGMSKKTLYQYFCDKAEMVKLVFESEIDSKCKEFDEISQKGMNALEELIAVFTKMNEMVREYNPATEYDLKKYYPDVFRNYARRKLENMYEWILANLKKGKSEGFYRDDMDEEVIAKIQVIRFEASYDNAYYNFNQFHDKHFFNELFKYHIRGIASERGLNFFNEQVLKQNN